MSILTPFFNLIKPAKNDPAAIAQLNANMDKIDTEMHKPPLTFNGIEPDPVTRNLQVSTVPLADNLTSDEAQINTGTYILRTSGGEASVSNGAASLSNIQGNMVKNGYVAQNVSMVVTGEDIEESTTIDEDAFIEEMTSTSGTMTFTFTTSWDVDPEGYGITVVGTPANGNTIVVTYTKENRGTITTASPTSFVSTGWNLYNNVTGYARVLKYSEEYGFMISGTYTSIAFARTLNGTQTAISPVNGAFDLPAGETSGYIIVTGGNATDTAIWMTWGDWTERANGGTFEPYTQTLIDLSEVMLLFPYGMMKVGNVADEINLNTQRAYNRIEKMEYTDANLEDVIASGMPYETDSGYIYAVMEYPSEHVISIDGEYTVSDHGIEMFYGTTVPLTASSLYGNDLKGKLRRDVVTISQQDLTAAQKTQVRSNLDVPSNAQLSAVDGKFTNLFKYTYYEKTVASIANGSGLRLSAADMGFSTPSGYKAFGLARYTSGSYKVSCAYVNPLATGDVNAIGIFNSSGAEQTSFKVGIGILYIKTGMGI